MKSKDIHVDEEYAIRPRAHDSGDCKRARVLEVGAERKRWRGYHYEHMQNGVRVVYLDRNTGAEVTNISDTMLLAKDILLPWSEYVPQLEKNREARAEGTRMRAERRAKAERDVSELRVFGVKSAQVGWGDEVKASPTECLDVMRRLAAEKD